MPDNGLAIPARLQLGTQAVEAGGLGIVQGYGDLIYVNNSQLQARSLYLRADKNKNGFAAGKAYTAFADLGTVPITVASGGAIVGCPTVTVDNFSAVNGILQARYARYWVRRISTCLVSA